MVANRRPPVVSGSEVAAIFYNLAVPDEPQINQSDGNSERRQFGSISGIEAGSALACQDVGGGGWSAGGNRSSFACVPLPVRAW